MKRAALILATLLLTNAAQARASVIFFSNDLPGFSAAVGGSTLLGTETFEQSTLPPATVSAAFGDPLQQGVANGPFPTGLVAPLTVQSNLSAGAATAPNPRGAGGLSAVSAGAAGFVSDVVVANFFVDSLDLIFAAGDQVTGVGFNALTFGSATVQVQVYDTANVLLGNTNISSDAAGTNFLGIMTTGGDLVGRINLFSLASGNPRAEGADNIQIYGAGVAAVPEPTSMTLLASGVVGLAGYTWRRRRAA